MARTIFTDLTKMPDDDHTKARAYLEFTKVLHEVESTVHAIPREAMKTDPHGLGSTVKLAERLDRKMERMSDVLREMHVDYWYRVYTLEGYNLYAHQLVPRN